MLVHVTELDLYRKFREDDDFPLEAFLAQLKGKSSMPMERGRAFHKAMEHAEIGETSILSADGHTFAFTCDAEIESWPRREERREKEYGGIVVTAACDRIMGRTIADDKTTGNFGSDSDGRYGAERYLAKFQWRYYLDIFDADVFRWHIWECRELDVPCEWEIHAHHLLIQHRYPEMHEDCYALAQEFAEFAERIGWQGSTRAA